MTYDPQQFAREQELERLRQEEEALHQEEERRRREEERKRLAAAQQQGAGTAGGVDPGTAMQMYSSFSGSTPAAGGIGGTAGTAGTAGSAGAAGGSAGGGASAASSGIASFWPAAVFVAAAAQHNWARKKGIHDNKDALTGKALQKDTAYYQPRLNEKLDGMGDEVRLAGLGSSPADLFRADTWKEAAKLAAQGGIVGKALKKLF